MKLKILELAQEEIEDSKTYYNFQQEQLGDTFKKDIQNAIDKIKESPTLYPEIATPIRRCFLHRFPFSIIYSITKNTIIILSVAHQNRKPFYWVDRILKE